MIIKRELNKINLFLITLLISIIFYSDKWIMNELSRIRFWDVINFSYPYYYDYGQLFFKYGNFLWYQNLGGGMPSYASQFSPYYTINFIAQLLEPSRLYALIVTLLSFISFYGMYLISSKALKFDQKISILCGFSYFLVACSTRYIHEEFFFIYVFPIFLYVGIYIYSKKIIMKLLTVLFIIFLFSLSPPVLTGPYYAMATILFLAIVNPEYLKNKKFLIGIIVLWLAYALFFIAQLYALYDYIPNIDRDYRLKEWSYISVGIKRFISYLLFSNTLFLIIPSILISIKIKELKRYFIGIITLYTLMLLVQLPTSNIYHGTIFEKMDLRHSWNLILFFSIMFNIKSLSESFKIKEMMKEYLKYFAYSTIVILILVMFYNNFFSSVPWVKIELLKNFIFSIMIINIIYNFNYNKKKIIYWITPLILIFMMLFLTKVLTLIEDNITWKKMGSIEFLKKNFKEGNAYRVATLGIPNAIVRYAGVEAYGGHNTFWYEPFKQLNLDVIDEKLNEFDNKTIKITEEYTYGLSLMLPYWIVKNPEVQRHWDGLPKNLGIDFKKLKKMNVTHIITTERHPELDKIAKNIIIDSENPSFKKRNYRNNLLQGIKNYIIDSNKYTQLIIYEINSYKDRYFFKDKNNNITYPEIIFKNPDNVKLKINVEDKGTLYINNNYDKNWYGTLNGKKIEILKTDISFQKIVIKEKGMYKIEIIYKNNIVKFLSIFGPIISFIMISMVYLLNYNIFINNKK